jgi:hypothetical protein
VRQLVTLHVLRGSWVAVKVAGATIRVERDASRAVADVVMLRSGKGERLAELIPEQATLHRFDLRLAREEGEWKVTAARWRPITPDELASGPELPPESAGRPP